jgi:arylsulfatase A-like enzyme
MNIVVIIADQLRRDHLGFSGRLPVRTPHIDALAARGHVFNRAYAANPVCMPNRATIMTGRWPSAHGLRTNGIPLDPDCDTFARVLRREGWRTAAVGKLHFQPMGYEYEDYQLDEIRANMPALWDAAVADRFGEGFVSWEDFDRHADGDVAMPSDYYGFDDVALVSGHGDRVSGNYVRWARERGFDPMTQAGRKRALSEYSGWNHVYESATPAALHPTTFVAEEASNRLEEFAAHADPFLLFVSFPDPHHPFAPPAEYFHRHDPADMPMPASFNDDHQDSPAHIREIISRRGVPDVDPMMLWSPTEEQYRHALAAELGSIEFIDDSIGRILGTIDRLGIADDTVIVFTSDHGDVFGDHGLILKHFTHYEGAIQVPLIISGGAVGRGSHEDLVSSADIAPTLLDLAHAPVLPRAQGRSMRAIMDAEDAPWRSALLVEEDQPFGIGTLAGPVRIRTVVTHDLRLTRIAGSPSTELYDLSSDPGERLNLAGSTESAELLARATSIMVGELMAIADDSVVPFHAA